MDTYLFHHRQGHLAVTSHAQLLKPFSHVETSDRYNVYRTLCTIHDMKMYRKMNTDRHLKFIMTMFQLDISDIAVHHYQCKNNLICPLCRVAQETELHFVLCCPVLRVQFTPSKFNTFLSLILIKPTAGIHQ